MSSKKLSVVKAEHDQKKHSNERKHICPICLKEFSYKCNLNHHVIIHSGDKPFECKTCNKQFNRKGNLDQHSLIHSDLKPFKCPTCFKHFSRKNGLNNHGLSHSNSKPFACSTCSKQFIRKSDLNQHMQVHSQEKTHECPKCLKQFRRRQPFKDHIKYQCGEESLKCQTCGKTFTTKDGLNRHVRGVHKKDRSYICDICQKRFSVRNYLVVHLRCHSGDKPFSCETCKRAFAHKSHLITHHKRHSKEKQDAPTSFESDKHLQPNGLLSDETYLICGHSKIVCHKLTKDEIRKHTSRGYSEHEKSGTGDGVELNRSELPSIKEESNIDDELAEPTPTSYPTDDVKQEAEDDMDPASINLCDDWFVKEENEVLSYLTSR